MKELVKRIMHRCSRISDHPPEQEVAWLLKAITRYSFLNELKFIKLMKKGCDRRLDELKSGGLPINKEN